ncbi:MAG: peptidyl-prolyl cis-trans isomerase, partial [Candidatus Cloacimonadota bacterium]|nr:peptidyl-prolyl cis-trans isomerase [Candidatus Cloacimonadota bacterium]
IVRNSVVRSIYNRLVVEDIDLSEEAARNYYEDNIKDFSTLHNRAIQTFVFKNKKAAENAYKKVKKALGYGFLGIRTGKIDSVKINEIIEESSEFSNNNGIIENIYDNGIIPGHGKDKYYSKKIWEIPSEEAKPHKLSDIFQNSKDEYVFFRIVEDNVAQAIPFEEVKEKVKRKMLKDLSQKKFKALEKELSEKFNLKKYPEKLIVKLTAEEYFKKAEDAQKRNNFKQAVYFYDQIIKYYPESQDEYKAKFMKGFVYAEDLNEKSAALDIFQNLVEKYPDGELNESAEYMIQELEGKNNIIEKIIEEK